MLPDLPRYSKQDAPEMSSFTVTFPTAYAKPLAQALLYGGPGSDTPGTDITDPVAIIEAWAKREFANRLQTYIDSEAVRQAREIARAQHDAAQSAIDLFTITPTPTPTP